MSQILPLKHQPKLPVDQIILKEKPDEDEAVPMDVLFVGGGPAGMAGAIHLAQLVAKANEAGDGPGEVEIGVLEKAEELGQHNLSGAVVNPKPFRQLFPDLKDSDFPFKVPVQKESVYKLSEKGKLKLPTPPTMKNHGNYAGSICEMVQWLGEKAEESGINVFTGFPVANLLTEDNRVVGVRTEPRGLDRDRNPGSGHEPGTDLSAQVVCLSEGCRGPLTMAWQEWQGVKSPNPQIYALGVKELWEVNKPIDQIVHTMGWPLTSKEFGGSWMYPMGDNLVSLGLVIGMDWDSAGTDVHKKLQQLKQHPLFKEVLQGGKLVEWGAKTIPEGGFHSFPDTRVGDGLMLLGDAAGFVDVPSLKGIHYAMQSGIYAAETIFEALKKGDTSKAALASYDTRCNDSYVAKEIHKTRNMRLAFKSGFFGGLVKSGLMTLTGGKFPGGRIAVEEDAAEPKTPVNGNGDGFQPDGELTFSKVDAVFRSGNATRDDIPSHLQPAEDVPEEVARMYEAMCPAGVYEWVEGKLRVNAPNCVDCRATDVIGPRWSPREGGSGPRYRRM